MSNENTAIAYCASCGDEMSPDEFIASTFSCCASCEMIQMEAKEILQIKRQIFSYPTNAKSAAKARKLQPAA